MEYNGASSNGSGDKQRPYIECLKPLDDIGYAAAVDDAIGSITGADADGDTLFYSITAGNDDDFICD